MKKITWLLIFLIGFTFIPSAKAIQKPSIVIIDTAVDTSVVKIIHEVCIMSVKKCPNQKKFMEGKGAATLPKDQLYSNNFDHGTKVALVAQKVNPEINIIFIRIVQRTEDGLIGYYSDPELIMSINWIIKNKEKFNIVSMSYSHGHGIQEFSYNKTNNCPTYSTTALLKDKINQLKMAEIPSFFSSGNQSNKFSINYPACISDGIAVGAVDEFEKNTTYGNESPDLDFYALGNYYINNQYIYGTSFSAAAMSALWAKSFITSYDLTYNYLKTISENSKISINTLLNNAEVVQR